MSDSSTTPLETPPPASPGSSRGPRSALRLLGKRQEQGDDWMLSFMDTLTLLVALFALLLSFSTVEKQKIEAVAEGLALDKYGAAIVRGNILLEDKGRPTVEEVPPTETSQKYRTPEGNEAADTALRRDLARRGLAELVEIKVQEDFVDLQLNEGVLFATGAAELSSEGLSVVAKLAPFVIDLGGGLSIEGHTDNIPISTERFPTNWELSSARAASVARALIQAGLLPSTVHIRGYAATRPIADNATEAGRHKNRRVNLVVKVSDLRGHVEPNTPKSR